MWSGGLSLWPGVEGVHCESVKVARHATDITADDVEALRVVGLSDEEIFDVTLAAAARCFFSTALDATGTTPDAAFQALDPALRGALTVGRSIDEAFG